MESIRRKTRLEMSCWRMEATGGTKSSREKKLLRKINRPGKLKSSADHIESPRSVLANRPPLARAAFAGAALAAVAVAGASHSAGAAVVLL